MLSLETLSLLKQLTMKKCITCTKLMIQNSLQERNKDGNLVGKANRKRHFFNSFPEEPFHFTAQSSSSYQGVRVKNINFTSTLNAKTASLKIMVYMFEDHGNITFGNETSELREGMLKFNIA